jgi:uncharacterized membrane protein YfcA
MSEPWVAQDRTHAPPTRTWHRRTEIGSHLILFYGQLAVNFFSLSFVASTAAYMSLSLSIVREDPNFLKHWTKAYGFVIGFATATLIAGLMTFYLAYNAVRGR